MRIDGVVLNARLLRRFARGLKADIVKLRASVATHDVGGTMVPESLRIDAKDWSIVVMGLIDPRVRASFPSVMEKRNGAKK